MVNEVIIQEIIKADMQELYNLLEPVKHETKELEKAYNTFKTGKKIRYHIEWNLKGYAETRERQQTVILNRKEYPIEDWWDEEEDRRTAARKALLEYYSEENNPYEAR